MGFGFWVGFRVYGFKGYASLRGFGGLYRDYRDLYKDYRVCIGIIQRWRRGFGLKVQAVEFRIQGLLSRKLGPMHLRVGILLADGRLRGPKRWDEGRLVKGS